MLLILRVLDRVRPNVNFSIRQQDITIFYIMPVPLVIPGSEQGLYYKTTPFRLSGVVWFSTQPYGLFRK
ncbi:hypothetical protein A4R26_00650 [Niastella populi]|uniref:Uncharacterized protein n=1 Tax=Niastella populi TaxID=550983 RepID=A0A1V9GCS0_9BACT|nr:hypothetical protein A4R26_00650 [Niastella populi]